MLQVLRRPVPPAVMPATGKAPWPGRPGAQPAGARARTGLHRFNGPPLDYDLFEHSAQVARRTAPALAAPAGTGLGSASTPVLVGGLGPGALRLAKDLLEPVGLHVLQAGGSGGRPGPDAPTRYVDGGTLAIELIRGDMSASGLGTVTHVVGDKVLAFGHPMLNGGIENLPASLGKVHWILATENRSFKIGEPTRPLGALVNDRQAAVVVDMSRQAPTFPIHLDIQGARGAPHPVWDFELAHDQFLAPNFTAVALGSAVETTTAERNDMTWRARSRVQLAGHGTVELRDFGAGHQRPVSPHDFARSRLVRGLGAMLNNPWQDARIVRIDSTIRVVHRLDILRLRGAQVLEPEIDVGQPVRIRLSLEPWRGPSQSRVIEVPIDPSLVGETVEIKLAPGHEVRRNLPAPESFAELLAVLPKEFHDDESVVASYNLPEGSAAFRGHVASRLPAGAVDTLRPTTQSVAPEVFAATQQTIVPLGSFLIGTDSVRVKVREVLR